VIIDQFIVAGQAKWQRSSGLVMLLPHGYEGQGPEHSNAYLERYLTACAEENIQVCVPTTPAQYFHVLRRQVKRPFRLPLVLMTPKSLLRHKLAVSPVDELVHGRFQEVLEDPDRPAETRRLVFCSGKVYYNLMEGRETNSLRDVELIRLEQLYPFPVESLQRIGKSRNSLEQIVWAQEEPMNRGAWSYMEPRLRRLFGKTPLSYAGRPAAASPAVGSMNTHRQEKAALVGEALGLTGGANK
jgi:2-oxoglutarate dehydrogenase E1 component